MKITKQMVRDWVDSEKQYDDCIEAITDIVNKDYSIAILRNDILQVMLDKTEY